MTVFVNFVFFLVGNVGYENELSQRDTPERGRTSSQYGAVVVGVRASYVPQVEDEARYCLHIAPGPLKGRRKGIPLVLFGENGKDSAGKEQSKKIAKDVLVVAGAAYKYCGKGIGGKAQLIRKAPSLKTFRIPPYEVNDEGECISRKDRILREDRASKKKVDRRDHENVTDICAHKARSPHTDRDLDKEQNGEEYKVREALSHYTMTEGLYLMTWSKKAWESNVTMLPSMAQSTL